MSEHAPGERGRRLGLHRAIADMFEEDGVVVRDEAGRRQWASAVPPRPASAAPAAVAPVAVADVVASSVDESEPDPEFEEWKRDYLERMGETEEAA